MTYLFKNANNLEVQKTGSKLQKKSGSEENRGMKDNLHNIYKLGVEVDCTGTLRHATCKRNQNYGMKMMKYFPVHS